jgi:hypothetical protein
MKRAPIIEDWSRFNRSVLEVADRVHLAAQKQAAPQQPTPQQPKPEPTQPEPGPEPIDGGDTYGLVARRKWRRHA